MTTLKEICISHGVRAKEREYIRLIAIEWLQEKRKFFETESMQTYELLLKELEP